MKSTMFATELFSSGVGVCSAPMCVKTTILFAATIHVQMTLIASEETISASMKAQIQLR